MSQYLSVGGLNWFTQNKIDRTDVNTIRYDNSEGCILEANIQMICTICVTVIHSILYHCKEIAIKYNVSVGRVKNLVPSLGNKDKYVQHYRNLQLYLQLGMRLTKIQ